MTNVEKLETFVELATSGPAFTERHYWDASDPDNVEAALDWFETELGFLSGGDRRELLHAWEAARNDGRCVTDLFRLVKLMQEMYLN